MIVTTASIQQFLGKEGYTRDDSIPFAYDVGYEGKPDDPVVIIDESTYFQDTDMLAEDFEKQKLPQLAAKLRKWAARQKNNKK